jgi:anti-sigma factor RsiW
MDLLSERLQLAHLYEAAPASLRKEIRTNLRPVRATTAMSQPLFWHWLAAAAALLLLAIAGWRVSPMLRSDDYQSELAEEIVDAHVLSLQSGHLTGIRSNDEHAVTGWFKGRLKVALPARDFANEGFALQGGRLDVVDERSVAVLVYARAGHLINVFVWPTQRRDTSSQVGSRQGFQWVEWRKGGIEFCAVSDAPGSDLQQLQRLFTN